MKLALFSTLVALILLAIKIEFTSGIKCFVCGDKKAIFGLKQAGHSLADVVSLAEKAALGQERSDLPDCTDPLFGECGSKFHGCATIFANDKKVVSSCLEIPGRNDCDEKSNSAETLKVKVCTCDSDGCNDPKRNPGSPSRPGSPSNPGRPGGPGLKCFACVDVNVLTEMVKAGHTTQQIGSAYADALHINKQERSLNGFSQDCTNPSAGICQNGAQVCSTVTWNGKPYSLACALTTGNKCQEFNSGSLTIKACYCNTENCNGNGQTQYRKPKRSASSKISSHATLIGGLVAILAIIQLI